jgi:hypothetical protein
MKTSLKIPKGGNQNPYIEEEQITQRPKEKVEARQPKIKDTNEAINYILAVIFNIVILDLSIHY